VALATEPAVLIPRPAPHVPKRALIVHPEPAPEEIAAIAVVLAGAVGAADVEARIESLPKWRRAARNYNDDYDSLRAARRTRV
jgi:hypothetical protein